jgi:hypothetical protein
LQKWRGELGWPAGNKQATKFAVSLLSLIDLGIFGHISKPYLCYLMFQVTWLSGYLMFLGFFGFGYDDVGCDARLLCSVGQVSECICKYICYGAH